MCDTLLVVWDWLGRNAASIIALIALFVAVWEVQSSRKHNRLSVRPELMQAVDASEDELFFRLGVTNSGLGPARVLSFGLSFRDQPIPSKNLKEVYEFINDLLHDVSHHTVVELIYPHYVMPPTERRDVLDIRFREISKEKAREVLGRLRQLDVDVAFESLYGERNALRPSKPGGG